MGLVEPVRRLFLLRWELWQNSQQQNCKRSTTGCYIEDTGEGWGWLKIKAGRPVKRLLQIPDKRDDYEVGRCGVGERVVRHKSKGFGLRE